MVIIMIMDEFIASLEKGDITLGVFIGLSKEFENVDHDILLSKLEHYGVRNALCWFQSYLPDRKHNITNNGATPTTKI